MLANKLHRIALLFLSLWIGLVQPVTVLAEDELIMGVFPRRNASITIHQFRPLADYLSQELHRKVKIETAKDFDSFWQGVAQRRYDLVHFNQYDYVQSKKQFGYEVILKNQEFGKQTIAGAILIRKDSEIQRLQDLKGKKVMFGGGKRALVSYISTTYMLREAGLKDGDYTEIFAKNPPNAAMGTYLRQADAGGVGDIALQLPIVRKRMNTDELRYLAVSSPLPHLPWAVKREMPSTLRMQIISVLSGLQETEQGRAILKSVRIEGLSPATDQEYDPVRNYIYEVNGEQY